MYLETIDAFDAALIKAWDNEIKPFVSEKFPVTKDGLFNVNSDIVFLVDMIDSFKEKYLKKKSELEKNKDSNSNKNINNINKRRATEQYSILQFELLNNNKINPLYNKDKNGKNKNDNHNEKGDVKLYRKNHNSKIAMFLTEFIRKNKLISKRSSSMINLHPHSYSLENNEACGSTLIQDKSMIEVNKLFTTKTLESNNGDLPKGEAKNIYKNIFNEKDPKIEKKQKGKKLIRSKSISLLREMTAFYKDEAEEEGYSIEYKEPERKLVYIYTDLLLKKIIFDDFTKNNLLLIHHFCQQCFCFINKEVFLKKIFHCHKTYKKANIPNEKLYNLIEFLNILIVEMFEYYQKINLKEAYAVQTKKFYYDLIKDILDSYIDESGHSSNNVSEDENDYQQFRFESLDFYTVNKNNEYCLNKDSSSNNNYFIINRKNLINMNLNIQEKEIKVFISKEEIIESEEKMKKEESSKLNQSIASKSEETGKNKIINGQFNKNYQEDVISQKKNFETNIKARKRSNATVLPWNYQVEQNDEKEKKRNIQILKTLRKSQTPSKKIKSDSIKEEDDQKEKSEEDENGMQNSDKELYSENPEAEEENSSTFSEDDSGNEGKTNENQNIKSKDKENEGGEANRQSVIIKNLMDDNHLSRKLLSINEKILNETHYIMKLFDGEEGQSKYQILKEAKNHLHFYKMRKNIMNKQKKTDAILRQRQSRYKKGYSSKFIIGSLSSKSQSKEFLSKGYFYVLDWKTEEIGEQLMKVSKTFLNRIYPRELYRGVFLKKDKEITSPNVVECINKFNQLTSFIIEDILSYDFPKERAKIYEKWVLIAEYCKENKDYNDLIAIFSALNHYVITGLKLTLRQVNSKINTTFKIISDFCTCEGNYRNIREDMNQCEKTGENFVPYLGMLMRDINFFEESSKYINENGCINFEKIEIINGLFEKYFKFKDVYERRTGIKELKFFEYLEDITEEELEKVANNLEPEFKLEGMQKPGKRPTKIDKKFFEQYKNISYLNKSCFLRNTISNFK